MEVAKSTTYSCARKFRIIGAKRRFLRPENDKLTVLEYWILDRFGRQMSWTPTDQQLRSQLSHINYGDSRSMGLHLSSTTQRPPLHDFQPYPESNRDNDTEPLVVIDKALINDIKSTITIYAQFEVRVRESHYKRHSFIERLEKEIWTFVVYLGLEYSGRRAREAHLPSIPHVYPIMEVIRYLRFIQSNVTTVFSQSENSENMTHDCKFLPWEKYMEERKTFWLKQGNG